MKTPFTFSLLMLTFLLVSCNSHTLVNTDRLPTESQLPQVPNCAADDPGLLEAEKVLTALVLGFTYVAYML